MLRSESFLCPLGARLEVVVLFLNARLEDYSAVTSLRRQTQGECEERQFCIAHDCAVSLRRTGTRDDLPDRPEQRASSLIYRPAPARVDRPA
jgi:hypothetical protein